MFKIEFKIAAFHLTLTALLGDHPCRLSKSLLFYQMLNKDK